MLLILLWLKGRVNKKITWSKQTKNGMSGYLSLFPSVVFLYSYF